MAIDTHQKRASVVGIGLLTHSLTFPDVTKGLLWRASVSGLYLGLPYGFSVVITATPTFPWTESQIVAGGIVITATLGGDTYKATFTDSIKQDLIDGITSSNTTDANGWTNLVSPGLDVSAITRVSNTIVTLTLPAFPTYDTTLNDVLIWVIPGSSLEGELPVTATPGFAIATDGILGVPTGHHGYGWRGTQEAWMTAADRAAFQQAGISSTRDRTLGEAREIIGAEIQRVEDQITGTPEQLEEQVRIQLALVNREVAREQSRKIRNLRLNQSEKLGQLLGKLQGSVVEIRDAREAQDLIEQNLALRLAADDTAIQLYLDGETAALAEFASLLRSAARRGS